VDTVAVSTEIRLPPDEVYEFLVDFPRYARYSKYLESVRQHGDGGAGTEYDLRFSWWKLTYTARSRVTELVPPDRIDWEIVKDIDAEGAWHVAEVDDPPEGVEAASRVRFEVAFSPDSADEGAVDLPAFVSLGWVIDKVKPKIVAEAERIVERVVADLEGERRDVELRVHERPDSV